MAETIYEVDIYLKSQDKPIRYKTSWFYVDEHDLNDMRIPFIKIDENYYRKDDILKIMVVDKKVEEEKKNDEPKKQNEQSA